MKSNKFLIFTSLLILASSISASALDPSLPVARINEAGEIVQREISLPVRYNNTYPYWSTSTNKWYADGWRAAQILETIIVITNTIPTNIQQVATNYVAKMESIFGVGAHTNTNLTEFAVSIQLSLDPNTTAEDGLRLKTWFDILNGFWRRGEIWTFPYNASEYVETNSVITWEIIQ